MILIDYMGQFLLSVVCSIYRVAVLLQPIAGLWLWVLELIGVSLRGKLLLHWLSILRLTGLAAGTSQLNFAELDPVGFIGVCLCVVYAAAGSCLKCFQIQLSQPARSAGERSHCACVIVGITHLRAKGTNVI